MTVRRWSAFSLLAPVLFLASGASHAACESLALRDFELKHVQPGTFESRNGEFSVTLPFKEQNLQFGSFGNKCLYAINIDSAVSDDHRSIEWVYLESDLSNDAFLAYWKDFIADYLAKNFGTGGYKLVAMSEFVMPDGRAAVRYAGTGTNNGGGEGTIYGVVVNFESRMANVYAITDSAIPPEGDTAGDDAKSVEAMAASIKR